MSVEFLPAIFGLSYALSFLSYGSLRSAYIKRIQDTEKKFSSSSSPSSLSLDLLVADDGKKYDVAIVHLRYPDPRDSGSFVTVLENDDVISKAVTEVRKQLIIQISTVQKKEDDKTSSSMKSDVGRYISETYSRIWDEVIQKGAFSLSCTVFGDMAGCNFAGPIEMGSTHTEVQAIYSPDVVFSRELIRKINAMRSTKKLKPVLHEKYGQYADSHLDDDVNYFFLDSVGIEIPFFKKIAIGGTFDRLHNGHKKLLTFAIALCTEELTIGISGDALLKNKKGADQIRSQESRMEDVRNFILLMKPTMKLNMVPISDPFGPTIVDANLEAIIVSSETIIGAKKINDIRRERYLKPLSIIVSRRGECATLSSTYLRNLEI